MNHPELQVNSKNKCNCGLKDISHMPYCNLSTPTEPVKCSECQFEGNTHSQSCSKYVKGKPFEPVKEGLQELLNKSESEFNGIVFDTLCAIISDYGDTKGKEYLSAWHKSQMEQAYRLGKEEGLALQDKI